MRLNASPRTIISPISVSQTRGLWSHSGSVVLAGAGAGAAAGVWAALGVGVALAVFPLP